MSQFSKRRLLVVGWDSADWKVIRPLMEAGQMPMLQAMVEKGSHGDFATLEPSLSPMLWTTMATGRHPADHGVHGFTEVRDGKVLPISAATRRCPAVWNLLSRQGLRTNLVSWFASHGERDPNVRLVSNLYPQEPKGEADKPGTWAPTPAGTYWPEELRAELDALRVHPGSLTQDVARMFIPELDKVDLDKDRRPHQLIQKLGEAFSVQAAAVACMKRDDWDLTCVYFRAIDEICHHFMPYHPPRMEGLKEEDFEIYKDVVNSTYRLHDLMLTRLVDLAGPDAGVLLVSDHGFHSDHLRPRFVPKIPAGIIAWHRSHGIVAAAGKGFRRGVTVEGARLPDLAPTILGWFGLPRSEEMMGRRLDEILDVGEAPADIPSWDAGPILAEAPTGTHMDDSERRKMLQHFVDLGYLEELPSDGAAAARATLAQNQAQLAAMLANEGRHEEALPLLEAAREADPSRPDIPQQLAHCQIHLGLVDLAEATLAPVLANFKNQDALRVLRANLAFQKGDYAAAYAQLEEGPDTPQAAEIRARSLLRLRRWILADKAARDILARDPGSATGWSILGKAQLGRGDAAAALESSRRALALDAVRHEALMVRAQALSALGRWDECIEAYAEVLRVSPGFFPAYRLMSLALRWRGRDAEADEVRARGQELRAAQLSGRDARLARLREESLARESARAAVRPPTPPPIKPSQFTLVSGLPRSGTSLMMQMLVAGGAEVMTDGKREANEDNPRGFLEWEDVKRLPKDPAVLSAAEGKVVKLLTPLLPYLPRAHRYRIVFMRRPTAEIVRSQYAMLERAGKPRLIEEAELARRLDAQVAGILKGLAAHKQVELLVVDYPELVADPAAQIPRIADFLGKDCLPHPGRMASAVDSSLRRQRA
ncbi:MAG: alkaline phosphatase family protein [Opitutia bacterium]